MLSRNIPSDDVNALLREAVGHHQQGRLAEAEKLYRQVLALAPMQPDAHNLLGVIARQTGHLDAAIELMTRATGLNPRDLNFQLNLANALLTKGDAGESAQRFRTALALNPGHAGAANGLGLALRSLGQDAEAFESFEQAARLDPALWDAAFNLGCAYELSGRFEPAISCYERALLLKPDSALALNNLGNCKQLLKRYAEAEADFRRALQLDPAAAMAHANLGTALLAQNKRDEAILSYRRAIELAPDVAETYNNLGRALQGNSEYDERVRCCERAIELRPDFVDAMINLAHALREQGRTAEALRWGQRALEIDPGNTVARSDVQFTMILLPGYDMAALGAANRDFWKHRPLSEAVPAAYSNSPDPQRRLRIGYVSGDYRRHAAAYFIEPIVTHHDRSRFEVFCYYSYHREDEYTQRFKARADAWRGILDLPDAEVAAMIRADGIDILVDLAGHTANSRITVFARRPAPVQVTYLGYPATTGLAAIDFRLTDAIADPQGTSDAFYVEKLWRLPASLVCYSPPPDMPEVGALPALANGFVTFGSFNGASKLGPDVVSLWARLLKGVPGSRLIITSIPNGFAQTRMADLFAADDVDPSRLKMFAGLSNVEFLSLYNEVDIALDPFPCNGGTSTCESLWMGVPVVCLSGDTFAGRVAPSMLSAAGHGEWIATDQQQYIDVAQRLAGDLATLSAIRTSLRGAARKSPLGDAEKFTRGLEQAYREMWTGWCSAHSKTN